MNLPHLALGSGFVGSTFLDPKTYERICRVDPDVTHLPGKSVGVCWWVKIPQYRLNEPLHFVDPTGFHVVVPSGFVFNGASVPWFLWPICAADHPDVFAASAVHDWLCTPIRNTTLHLCDSRKAAYVFWCAMRSQGMYPWGAQRNYLAVRWFGPRF